MNFTKTGLALIFTTTSAFAIAGPYNHVDHNDPGRVIATNAIYTLNCGSSSLSTCIDSVNITNTAQQACKDKVRDESDGYYLGPNAFYYHTINSHAERIISVIDNNNGSGAFAYTVNIQHSCGGFEHIPPRSDEPHG